MYIPIIAVCSEPRKTTFKELGANTMFWMNSMYLSRACRGEREKREEREEREEWREEGVGGREDGERDGRERGWRDGRREGGVGWQGVGWRKGGRWKKRSFDGMQITERETHSSSGQTVIPVKAKHNVNNLRS